MAMVLVVLAVTDGSPSQIKVGKVTRVPPPAMEFIAPARKAEPNAAKEWINCGAGIRSMNYFFVLARRFFTGMTDHRTVHGPKGTRGYRWASNSP